MSQFSGTAAVFGGSGFLGSHVVDALVADGFKVKVFDAKPPHIDLAKIEFVQGDILDADAVAMACGNCDYIYNFAGLADINEAKDKPSETAKLNILGNINVLEGARAARIKRFIYASTVYVYSESGSFYRVSKQASERYTELYYDTYELPFTILRFGSLYGRRADGRNNIYRLIHSALTTGQIAYPGTGEELREYINVLDAARASIDILAPDYKNQHVVLTGHQAYRIKDVMLMISEMLGQDTKLVFDNKDVEAHYNITPYAYKPRLAKKLAVNPYVDLGQGILECIHEVDHELKGSDQS